MTYWMRPPEIDRHRQRDLFDPVVEGARYHLSRELSLAIWKRACDEATDAAGRRDPRQAQRRFHAMAAQIAARGGRLLPEVGRLTCVGSDDDRAVGGWGLDGWTLPVPGRTSLVAAEAWRWKQPEPAAHAEVGVAQQIEHADRGDRLAERSDGPSAGSSAGRIDKRLADRSDGPSAGRVDGRLAGRLASSPGVRVAQAKASATERGSDADTWTADRRVVDRLAMAAGSRPALGALFGGRARGHDGWTAVRPGPAPLPNALRERMERAFGQRFDDVEIHRDSTEVPAGQQAFARSRQIFLEPGAVDLDSKQGEHVLAHELAHVVQQRGGGDRAGTPGELEREARRAAALAIQGAMAPIALRAQPAMAYAFSDGEDAAVDTEPAEPPQRAEQAEHDADRKADQHDEDSQDKADAQARAAGPGHDGSSHAPGDADAAEAAPAGAAAHDDAAGETIGEMIDVSGGLGVEPAEGPPAGHGGGGGGPAAKPLKEPPNVAAAKPEAGLAQLKGVRPDKLGPVLGQVHTAASADASKARAAQAANPPKQMSSGAAAAGAKAGADGKPKDAAAPAPAKPAGKQVNPDHPVKGEVPGGEAAKQAKQGQAAEQQKSAGQVITTAAQQISSWFSSMTSLWSGNRGGGGSDKDNSVGGMSEADARKMAGSVDNISTSAGVPTDTGPAPSIAMKGEAKGSAEKNRAALEAKTAGLERAGRADSRVAMGEDHIDPPAPEELCAKPPEGGTPADPALPTLAGAAATEEVGIVAQEQHGAEIDAALAKASADVGTERGKHAQEEAKARAESDDQVRALKSKAEADQAAARSAAQAEVQAARGQWQSELDKKGADARKQGDKKVAEGMAHVEAEESKANAEAKKHIAEGKQKAEEEKQKGEKEAADAKEKGKSKSSGFFGWLADRAKAAFDGIKKAVSAAIDACRRAVKAVIDAAKKMAMAAIELARRAITAAIKAVGEALIAISNVLLAAFPELKAKFQAAIRKSVDKAVNAVNKLADGLKRGVQKALDLLGKVLDKALQLLEKGIHFIVDAASAAVQGAIKAAQAFVDMLGTWAQLIKDIASAPGAWLSKLGAAVVDGIKNHLWPAFKTVVVEWFKAKVFELLGVGGLILQLLLEGGLNKDAIVQMAMDALIVAIPAALVMILVEKLVAMIVPAAGAVMAVIEGLQAAWGTISRIIAAFSAFMAFLIAVKGGGAGPLFATVLASAAVVVLDFVANWLLKKLASAAKKVGAKLKGLAEKFKNKRKVKRDAKAKATKHHDEHHDHKGKKDKHHDDKARSKEDKRKEEIAKRVEKAQRELPPKVSQLLAKKPSRLRVLAQFAVWRLRYHLSKLELAGNQGKLDIHARVNPDITLAPGWTFKDHDVFRVLDEIAGEMLAEARATSPAPTRNEQGQLDFTNRTHPTEPAAHLQPGTKWTKKTDPPTAPPPGSQYIVGRTEDGTPIGYRHEQLFPNVDRIRPMDDGFGSNYGPLVTKLQGVNVGEALGKLTRNEKVPNLTKDQGDALGELHGLWMGGKEAAHPKGSWGNQRDLTYSYMTGQMMGGGMSLETAAGMHPAAFGGAQKGARRVNQEMSAQPPPPLGTTTKADREMQAARDERYDREKRTSEAFFKHNEADLKAWFAQRMKLEQRIEPREPTIEDIKEFVRHQIRLYLKLKPHG